MAAPYNQYPLSYNRVLIMDGRADAGGGDPRFFKKGDMRPSPPPAPPYPMDPPLVPGGGNLMLA